MGHACGKAGRVVSRLCRVGRGGRFQVGSATQKKLHDRTDCGLALLACLSRLGLADSTGYWLKKQDILPHQRMNWQVALWTVSSAKHTTSTAMDRSSKVSQKETTFVTKK